MNSIFPIHAEDEENEVTIYEELKGKSVGIQTGSLLDRILPNIIEDVTIVYFESLSDMREALLSGKVDAISADEPKLRYMSAMDPQITYLKEVFEPMEYGYIFNKEKGKGLCNELNQYIKKIKESGFLDEMINEWFDPNNIERQMPDYESLPNINGKISYAIDASIAPFGFVKDGKYAGLEVELMSRFCEEKGYALEISNMQFAALIPGIYSGKYDVASSCITITEERAQSVLFSDPTYIGGSTLAFKRDSERPKLDDYAEKRIAVITGTIFSQQVSARLPRAKQVFYETISDCLMALKTDKVDAIAVDEPVARNIIVQEPSLVIAEGYLESADYAFAFSKSENSQKLSEEISSYITELKRNGDLKQLQDKWFDNVVEESLMSIKPDQLIDTNGTIKVAVYEYPPFTVQENGRYFGYEIELLTLFAKEKGYALDIDSVNANALSAIAQGEKWDMLISAVTITEERKEEIIFSSPSYSGGAVLLVSKQVEQNQMSFIDSIIDSFNKTFIREDRYKLFLQGIATTILITLASVLFGTILGFVIYLLCRKGNIIANSLAKIFTTIMTGLPMVVLLMILYYIIFGKTSISGTVVSIIGFSLVFAAEVYGMVNNAIKAVDYGQTEAAYALGYGYWESFFRYIIPQAVPYFLPPYRGSLVSLVKATAIVGYVAVQDLTKMGDIVRSRTYEAFFPLIAVALIYFALGGLLVFIINRITVFLDPTRRSKKDILKGIDTHDRN